MKKLILTTFFVGALFSSAKAFSSENLEKFRFNPSDDTFTSSSGSGETSHYRTGQMIWKLLNLNWEIAKDVKSNSELSELEKFRFDPSNDMYTWDGKNYYLTAHMLWKLHNLTWEIAREIRTGR